MGNSKNPTTRERLAIVENEVKHVNSSIDELQTDFDDMRGAFNGLDKKVEVYNETLKVLSDTVESKLRGSLSGKEKASIIVALITSISAIIISCIK